MNTVSRIYLDNNSTTPLLPAVWEAMQQYALSTVGNPASAHRSGATARRVLDECRAMVATCLGAFPDEVIFTWIEERRTEYPVAVLCRVRGVSRAGYDAWRTRAPSDTARRRGDLTATIRAIHEEPHLDTYGRPRMARERTACGVACGVNTVAKVMAEAGIRAKTARRFVRTTDSRHRLPVSENVLDREFTATKPNEKWGWT